MKHPKLAVAKRTVLGKNVKRLRKEGVLPANIYGKGIKSVSIQVQQKDFETLFKEVGETGLVDIEVDGEIRPTLIHNVQRNPMSHAPLHIDFYQVNLKEKIKTMVPVVLVGEAQAVTDKLGLLMQVLSEVEVEALPEELPENIEVPVEHLSAVDEQVTIGDLKVPAGVEILTDKEQVVVKVAELVSKEAEEQAAADAAAAEAAKAATEGSEGETPVEGEQPAVEGQAPEEAKTEEKKE